MPQILQSTLLDSKTDLRNTLKKKRDLVSHEKRENIGATIHSSISKLAEFKYSENIGLYLNIGTEAPTQSLIELCYQLNKKVYAPIITDYDAKEMAFAPLIEGKALQSNRWGIAEPIAPTDSLIQAQDLDILFLPLLGFDLLGNRIGMGAGYYDRELSMPLNNEKKKLPFLVGLGFSDQQVKKIPRDSWDVPISCIITEADVFRVNP